MSIAIKIKHCATIKTRYQKRVKTRKCIEGHKCQNKLNYIQIKELNFIYSLKLEIILINEMNRCLII